MEKVKVKVSASQMQQVKRTHKPQNKALHPTAYISGRSLLPHGN